MVQKQVLSSRIMLCLLFAISGAVSMSLLRSPSPPTVVLQRAGATPEVLSAYFLAMKLTNRVYNESLKDHNSQDYKALRAEVEQVLHSVYGCSSCATVKTYAGVEAMTFSNGSVIANSTLQFSTTMINSIVVKNLFLNTLIDNPPKYIAVDISYTIQVPPVPAPVPKPTTTSQPKTTQHLSTHSAHTQVSNTTITSTTSPLSPSASTSNVTQHASKLTSSRSGTTSSEHPSSTSNTSSRPAGHSTAHRTASTETTSSNTHSPVVTLPVTEPNTTQHSRGATTTSPSSGGVPGWGIALLVLACVILVLLIVLIIVMIWRWCCHRNKKSAKTEAQRRNRDPNPYGKHSAQPSAPELTGPIDQPYQEDLEKPKKNKTGMYVVNY